MQSVLNDGTVQCEVIQSSNAVFVLDNVIDLDVEIVRNMIMETLNA